MARASKGKKGKKGNSVSVDLTDVESKVIREDGDYLLTVVEVEKKEGEDSGEDYLSWKFEIEGGGTVYENTSMSKKALWRLRGMLEALGYDIPDGPFDLDPSDLIDETCGGTIVSETYNQKKKNIVIETFPADQLGDEEDGEEEEEEEETPKKGKGKKEKGKSKSKMFNDEDEDGDDEEEEDEEEEPKPKKGKKGKGKKAKKGKIKKGSDVTFEDDGEEYEGTVVKVSKDGSCEVEVDDEVWELETDDLTLA